jgi:alcohol dehydrogenase (cytochrome c)
MTVSLRVSSIAVLLAVLGLPVVVAVQSGNNTANAGRDWPTVTGGAGNMRYSPLNQISAQNVARLGAAWTSDKLDAAVSSRAMTVVTDGLLFFTAPPFVYALDAKTGKTVWRYGTRPAPGAGRGGGAPVALPTSAPAREGVAVADGLVFVGMSDARVVALREKTGELVWNQYVGDNPRDKGQVISGAPLFSVGLVSVGLSADNGWRGQIVALDPKTGKEAWRFFSIPGAGEKGHETWPPTQTWTRGGGAVWLVGTDDPATGSIYYVTGNGVPQLGGEGRAGDNLYLCSVIALDAKTGALKWHYQVIHHDIWEGDISSSPVLYDMQIDGRPRKGIAAIRADGYLFMLDRETGKPFSKVEERAVPQDATQKTAATQPFPVGADRVLDDCDTWKKRTTPKGFEIGCFFTPPLVQKPNVLAPNYGMRVAPMSYSPQTGYFYVTGAAGLSWLRRADDPHFFSNSFNARVPGINALNYGVVAAIDSRTNKIAWKKEYRPGRPSGAMTTAGGLLFQVSGDGNLEALDPKTGNRVWQFQTGAAGGPPTTYEIDGEQYVTTISGSSVWAFKLGGTLPPATAPVVPMPEAFAGQITDTNQIETASLARDNGFTGFRYFTDEYAFAPYRAKVKAGTQATWRNNGRMVHTIVATDGSWTTGALLTGDVGGATFDKPGTYTYICKEHPWAYGQVIVE